MTEEEVIALVNKKKKPRIAKNGSLLLLFLLAIIGILGSFDFMKFNMADFVLFLGEFKGIIITLIGSIGGGAITKAIVDRNKE